MRASVAILAALALFGGAADAAAPLCRDLKGLFHPCPVAAPKRPAARGAARATPAPAAAPPADHVGAAPAARPGRPPPFARGRLCRDGKGLAVPCPR